MDVRISNQPPNQLGLEDLPGDPASADEHTEAIKNQLAGIFGNTGGLSGVSLPSSGGLNEQNPLLQNKTTLLQPSIGTVLQPTTGGLPQTSPFLQPRIGTVLPTGAGVAGGATVIGLKTNTGSGTSGTSSAQSSMFSGGLMNPDADYIDASDSSTTGSTTDGSTTASTTGSSANSSTSSASSSSSTDGSSSEMLSNGLVNPDYDFTPAETDTSDMASVTSDDDDGSSSSAPTFGQAAKTLNNWMNTSSTTQGKNASIDMDDLQDIVNGTGKGAGASDDVKAAAQEMLSDGGAQFKATIGGKDGKASTGDFGKYVANDTSTPLTDDEMSTLSVLDRHADAIAGKTSDIQKKIDDPSTPSDLKAALQQLQKDPSLLNMLDAGKNGKVDGKIGKEDISRLTSKRPEMVAYNEQQAQSYVDNYIPSDDTDDPDAKPREMDANDAMRELYRYSDYLPGNISKQSLQDIVDGTGSEGKAPAQLKAAAEYMLSNPSAWSTVAGSSGSVSRGHMEDAISKNITLDQNENTTMQTLSDNESTFFGDGNLTRDKLTSIVNDPKSSDAVKTAAQQLLNDPMLFGMLDNGKKGSSGNLLYAADDGKISKGDFEAFKSKLTTAGQVASTPATHEPTTAADQAATQAMEAGTEDQPEQKKSKGGGLIKFFEGILHVFSKILDVASTILGALAKIPGIGEIFAGASVATKLVSGEANVAADAIGGASKEQIGKDEEQAFEGAGEAAIGAVTVPGVGGALMKGAEEGVDAATTATSTAVKSGLKDGVTDAAKDNAEDAATSQAQQEYQQRTAA
ncbi:HrpF/NolX family T3SS translocon protein [Robbsia sp. KACC 23696]|uniref:HrpF/NolX family T3SS translocon protein n=1 Tax=Robbsia sp. KACC 23696 TaxID=3149231 RepID=UPI00325AAA74